MFLINQDHDQIVIKSKPITIRKHYHSGKFYGFNLYHGIDLLGTFDNYIAAFWQRLRIALCTKDYCIIGGYFRSNAFESLYEALTHGIHFDLTGAAAEEGMNCEMDD
jgi:hypothetical protein